jgi:hypothetical protein
MAHEDERDYDAEELYQNTDSDSMERWLDDCEEVVDIDLSRGGPGFSSWEKEFLSSLREQFDERSSRTKKPLTGKQLVILRKLWDRI